MRAGSLGDDRAVALLTDFFVPVQVPELSTAELIEEPADVALMRRYDELLRDRGGLFGGVRELVLSPDGDVLAFYCALDLPAGTPEAAQLAQSLGPVRSQKVRAGREDPEGMVRVMFHHLAACARAVRGELPAGFERYLDGTAPTVAAVRATPIPQPQPEPGQAALRVAVRNSTLAHDTLVGIELLPLSEQDQQALVPSGGATTREWPRDLVVRLGQVCVPRGQVATTLLADSVQGSVTATVLGGPEDGRVRGELRGELVLEPRTREEAGRRRVAAVRFRSELSLFGDYVADAATGRVLAMRLCADSTALRWLPGPWHRDAPPPHHLIGAELVRGAADSLPPRREGQGANR